MVSLRSQDTRQRELTSTCWKSRRPASPHWAHERKPTGCHSFRAPDSACQRFCMLAAGLKSVCCADTSDPISFRTSGESGVKARLPSLQVKSLWNVYVWIWLLQTKECHILHNVTIFMWHLYKIKKLISILAKHFDHCVFNGVSIWEQQSLVSNTFHISVEIRQGGIRNIRLH